MPTSTTSRDRSAGGATENSERAVGAATVLGLAGLFISILISVVGTSRMAAGFASCEQAVLGFLARARIAAVQSGRTETRVWLERDQLRIRAGAEETSPIIGSLDLGRFRTAVAGENLPIRLGADGHRLNPDTPVLTIHNPWISARIGLIIRRDGRAAPDRGEHPGPV
jgi:hypothetical protein